MADKTASACSRSNARTLAHNTSDTVLQDEVVFHVRLPQKELYVSRGQNRGPDQEDWYEAERVLEDDMARSRGKPGN